MQAIRTNYFDELTAGVGQSWNRFWFTPADPLPLCVVRIGTGLLALGYFLSLSGDLTRWFAASGLLPVSLVETWLASSGTPNYHYSLLSYFGQPAELWGVQACAIVVSLLLAAGLFTRISTVLTLLMLLSYIHRAPMIAGHQEPVLAFLLFYLCIAPAGKYLSVDAWLARRRAADAHYQPSGPALSLAAAIALRLIQVHLAAFVAMSALNKVNGYGWWNGEAMWVLMAQTHSRPLDLSGIRDYVLLLNAWTHAIVIFELLFPVLIWNRLARPILLVAGAVLWLSLALVTGLGLYALTLIVGTLAFVSPETWRSVCGNCACVAQEGELSRAAS